MRPAWFVAGVAAGVWGAVRARRLAYRFSVPGLTDQAAALGVGWREFARDVHTGMARREQQIARELSLESDEIEPMRHNRGS